MDLVRQDLSATAERVESLRYALERAEAERDRQILAALECGLPSNEAAALANVSAHRVRLLARHSRPSLVRH